MSSNPFEAAVKIMCKIAGKDHIIIPAAHCLFASDYFARLHLTPFLCSYRLKTYPKTFLGSDLCTWLVNDEAASEFKVSNRAAAVTCGLAMFHYKVNNLQFYPVNVCP